MTRKLEEEFGLAPIPEDESEIQVTAEPEHQIAVVEDAITISEKINGALAEVKGMEFHDGEMDEIALAAMGSYEELMGLGMNMTDMAAGGVFNNAAAMLKVALDAKDSKVNRKLKQIDLMLKKANLDQRSAKAAGSDDAEEVQSKTFDRNDLLAMLDTNKKDE